MNVWIIKYHLDGTERYFKVRADEIPEGCTGDDILFFVFRRFYLSVPDFDDIALLHNVAEGAVAS